MYPNTNPTRWNSCRTAILGAAFLLLALVSPQAAVADPPPPGIPGDFGDAPEGITAYSNVDGFSVIGQFPSRRSGTIGAVHHTGRAPSSNFFLGQSVDYEWDAIGEPCNGTEYEADEPGTLNDCDAGIANIQLYTINSFGLEEALFGPGSEPFLGPSGTLAVWGQGPGTDIDLWVTNNSPQTAYLNALFDWDQDGTWTIGSPAAPSGLSPAGISSTTAFPWTITWNRAITNFPIPPFFSGWFSSLNPHAFIISGRGGFVWGRFTITAFTISAGGGGGNGSGSSGWSGGGNFGGGESEDYLFRVGDPEGGAAQWPGEYGDAPEAALAYPNTGVFGDFPTCTGGNNGFIKHGATNGMYFGPSWDHENDGNADDCPFFTWDDDEKQMDGDAGLTMPGAWTIQNGQEVFLGQAQSPSEIGPECSVAYWGTDIDIMINNLTAGAAYVNVLFDFNGDGVWGGQYGCPTTGALVNEYPVVNALILPGSSGLLSQLVGPGPLQLGGQRSVWARFTITDQPAWPNWTGTGMFNNGETEDYLLRVGQTGTAGTERLNPADIGLQLTQNVPNPVVGGRTRIDLNLDTAGPAQLDLFDVTGRLVRTLASDTFEAGRLSIEWDGRDASGMEVPSGIYLYRLASGGRTVSKKLIVAEK